MSWLHGSKEREKKSNCNKNESEIQYKKKNE